MELQYRWLEIERWSQRELTGSGIIPEGHGTIAMKNGRNSIGISEDSSDVGGCVKCSYELTSCLKIMLEQVSVTKTVIPINFYVMADKELSIQCNIQTTILRKVYGILNFHGITKNFHTHENYWT